VFELSGEASAVLADEEASLWFAAGAFHGAAASPELTDQLAASFRSGAGLSFDDLGPEPAGRGRQHSGMGFRWRC